MAHGDELLTSVLEQVSRTFYRTLRMLPGKVRRQIALAYLLARTTDTIADTGLVPMEKRLQALEVLRQRINGAHDAPLDFGELARHQGEPAERLLLERCEQSLALLQTLSPADLQRVRSVLEAITSGQELDLRRFADASSERIIALHTDAELDDYTYRVAGCVGEFWTKMVRAHLFPRARVDDAFLLENGVRFGKGLQLVNILRDLPFDLRQGRCYVPGEALAASGLAPADLLEPGNESKFRPLYHRHLDRAEAHLAAGWAYTNALPRGCVRVRLACAWPIQIGMQTLARLREAAVLNPQQRIKISRRDVRHLMLRSLLSYPWPGAWQRLVNARANG
jgi:farnesyl-diphosphate farnesyltransferase